MLLSKYTVVIFNKKTYNSPRVFHFFAVYSHNPQIFLSSNPLNFTVSYELPILKVCHQLQSISQDWEI